MTISSIVALFSTGPNFGTARIGGSGMMYASLLKWTRTVAGVHTVGGLSQGEDFSLGWPFS